MSFGFSPSDLVFLLQLANRTYRNCQNAGAEYRDIKHQVRCLRSVLQRLQAEAQSPESKVFAAEPGAKKELQSTIEGCKDVLSSLDDILAKFSGVQSTIGLGMKIWQRWRFGNKIAELATIRGKIVTYVSSISLYLDTLQVKASNRIEEKIDDVHGELRGIHKVIDKIAAQAQSDDRAGSTVSFLSFSTRSGDDKLIWREFRRELIKRGFGSERLDRHKDKLLAYMVNLDQREASYTTQPQTLREAAGKSNAELSGEPTVTVGIRKDSPDSVTMGHRAKEVGPCLKTSSAISLDPSIKFDPPRILR